MRDRNYKGAKKFLKRQQTAEQLYSSLIINRTEVLMEGDSFYFQKNIEVPPLSRSETDIAKESLENR